MPKINGRHVYVPLRAEWWDYGADAAYFVTIKTKNNQPFFGEILDEKMSLYTLGESAKQCWLDIPAHFPFVQLGVHAVLPDHIHGIVIINKQGRENLEMVNIQYQQPFPPRTYGPQSQNLGSIIRGFKVGVTMASKRLQPEFAWHSKYKDRIIRDMDEYRRIEHYIKDNVRIHWERMCRDGI